MEATFVSGNGTETGQIITTTVVGRNGQPKQVMFSSSGCYLFGDLLILLSAAIYHCFMFILISCRMPCASCAYRQKTHAPLFCFMLIYFILYLQERKKFAKFMMLYSVQFEQVTSNLLRFFNMLVDLLCVL